MRDTYICNKHGTVLPHGTGCPGCAEAFANRRNPDTMTGEEREAELRWWGKTLTIPFGDLRQRYEELVGRPIWSHELADPEPLIVEARTRTHPTPDEILAKLPLYVNVIAVEETP